jgi:hypothetical protein
MAVTCDTPFSVRDVECLSFRDLPLKPMDEYEPSHSRG